jgi:1-acyl-sn-glycerol-3-phosphate acyltransferase
VVLAEMREQRPSRHDDLEAHDQRARGEPDRRAGRRHPARAARYRAQDLERQDPPRRRARILRARAGGGAGGAVWLQFVRLVLAGAAPQLRRGLRTLQGGRCSRCAATSAFALLIPVRVSRVASPSGKGRLEHRADGIEVVLFLAGIPVARARQENLPARTTVVLAVNHTSYLDALVLLAILDYRGYAFVAKREFQDNFLMRALLSGFGTQFIERFDVAKSTEHASELAEAAKRGVSLIVFPEGTLTRNTGLMGFATGDCFQGTRTPGRG